MQSPRLSGFRLKTATLEIVLTRLILIWKYSIFYSSGVMKGPYGSLIWGLLRNLLTRSETWPNMRCFLVTPYLEEGGDSAKT